MTITTQAASSNAPTLFDIADVAPQDVSVVPDLAAWKLSMRSWKYAGRWLAETEWRREAGESNEPTDEAFRETFKNCVIAPKPEMYPHIRKHLLNWDGEPPRRP